MESSVVTTDTIRLDSSSRIVGDIRAMNKLTVMGNARFSGGLQVDNGVLFDTNNGINFQPATIGNPAVITFGGILNAGPVTISPCFGAIPPTTVNKFGNILQVYDNTAAGNTFNTAGSIITIMGATAKSFIDTKGGTTGGLDINTKCGQDVNICTGNNAFVTTGNHLEIGSPVRDVGTALNVNGKTLFSGNIQANTLSGLGNRIVYADASGNLKVGLSGGIGAAGPCIAGADSWYNGGNFSPTDNTIGTCDFSDFILKANGIKSIWIRTDGKIGFGISNPNEKFHFSGGNVRIDGSAPGSALTINTTNTGLVSTTTQGGPFGYNILATVNQDLTKSFVVGNNTGAYYEPFTVYGNGQVGLNIKPSVAVNGNAFVINDATAGKIIFNVKATGQTFIGLLKVQTGNVHANAMLQVGGKIACQELIVLDPVKWADYVFKKDYKLPEWEVTENYFNTYQHLKDVPTTKEVNENGVNVGETQTIFLKKLEEAYLYIGEAKKEIKELRAEVKELKNKLNNK